MKVRVAICDEKNIANDLKLRLLEHRQDYNVDIFDSGQKLLENINRYDMIFMDIEMLGMNGMDVATKLRNTNYTGHLIFMTNYMEYLSYAFKVRAFRFFQKPVSDDDLEETIKESEREIIDNKTLMVCTSDEIKIICLRDLIYLESDKNYTYLYTKSGVIHTRKTMREWMELLESEHFVQVHKSYVVALRYVDSMKSNCIVMKHLKTEIPVSRRKMNDVKNALLTYTKYMH